MTIVGALFGVGLVVVGALAYCAPERRPALTAWAFLVAGWLVTVLIAPSGVRYVWMWAWLDMVFGLGAMWLGIRYGVLWPIILAAFFLTQSALHIIWSAANIQHLVTDRRIYDYYRAINALMIMQMVCVAQGGFRRVLRLP